MPDNEICPDCGESLEYLGTNGTFGIGNMMSEVDVFDCPNRHIWLRAAPPIIVEPEPIDA